MDWWDGRGIWGILKRDWINRETDELARDLIVFSFILQNSNLKYIQIKSIRAGAK